jgi:pimeloyl-ACP methyl ester carboxylesterase
LATRHRLVRYDARGNGLSDREVEEISLNAFVRDLEAVVDAQGLERFPLYGLSQGAAVAIAYAARHPERVTRLVLHGGYALGRNRRGQPQEAALAQAFVTMMRQGWGQERSAFMQAFSAVYLPGASAERVRWWSEQQRATTSAGMAIRIRTACDEIDVTAQLPTVRAPTLVLHGRNDAVVPFAEGRRIAAGIPGARFVALESENHVMVEDEPAWSRCLDAIEGFLAE